MKIKTLSLTTLLVLGAFILSPSLGFAQETQNDNVSDIRDRISEIRDRIQSNVDEKVDGIKEDVQERIEDIQERIEDRIEDIGNNTDDDDDNGGNDNGNNGGGNNDDDDTPDTTAPRITFLRVASTARYSTILFRTDEDASARLYVSKTQPVSKTSNDTIVVNDGFTNGVHRIRLSNLDANTTYYALLEVRDEEGNVRTSSQFSFVTKKGSIASSDTSAPLIGSVSITNVDTDSARVTWNTNEAASSRVYLSTVSPVDTDATSTVRVESSSLVTSHSLDLTGLSQNTKYYLRVESTDAAGNVRLASQRTFTTTGVPVPDTTAPVISNVSVSNIDTDSARVTWNTNENSDSRVYISTSSPVDVNSATHVDSAAMVTGHAINLTNLSANTQYFIIVESRDASGNVRLGTQTSFTTEEEDNNGGGGDTQGPVISNVTVTEIDADSARITWTTDEASDSRIYLSTTNPVDPNASQTIDDGSMVTNHSVVVSGLSASTDYYFIVDSQDASGNNRLSAQGTFTTLSSNDPTPDTTDPVNTNINIFDIDTNSAAISWDTDEPATARVYISTQNPIDIWSTTTRWVEDDQFRTNRTIQLINLTANTQYYLIVESTDQSGNVRAESVMNFTTDADAPQDGDPVVTNLQVVDVGTNSARVTWTTNENADSRVYLSTTNPVDPNNSATFDDPAMVTSHSVVINGLTPNTQYFIMVDSQDGSGNVGASSQVSFTTDQEDTNETDTTPPVITEFQITDVDTDSAVVRWITGEVSDTKVYFSTSSPLDINTSMFVEESPLISNHWITLGQLSADTQYYVIVESKDSSGNVQRSAEASFTTDAEDGGPINTAPVISNLTVVDIGENTARVTWTTNEAADSRVYLSTSNPVDPNASATFDDSERVLNHSVVVTGLTPNTQYFIVVDSQDESGEIGMSTQTSFTTDADNTGGEEDTTDPVISGAVINNISSGAARALWTTDEPATSRVYVSATNPVDVNSESNLTFQSSELRTDHSLDMFTLNASTTYYVVLESTDAAGNVTRSAQLQFTTAQASSGDTTAPEIVNIGGAINARSIQIVWSTTEPTTGRIYYSTESPVTTESGTLFVEDATLRADHDLTFSGLQPQTMYHFIVVSTDAAGNEHISGQFDVETPAEAAAE